MATAEGNDLTTSQLPDLNAVLNALPNPVLVVDEGNRIKLVNHAAEQFFASGAGYLIGRELTELLPADSPVFRLVDGARLGSSILSDYDLEIETPRIGKHNVGLQASAIPEWPGCVSITINRRSVADKLYRQMNNRGAARSVTAMASMLAHEVKNPLSGIRGAAQLLEMAANEDDKPLTKLICDETDRICALVDRMEAFSDERPIRLEPVNIHEVLEHCRRIAQNGFGQHVTFFEQYDPSLPPVLGNRDILVQIFLNLLKNASEAVPEEGGEIYLSTAYHVGMRIAVAGSDKRVDLPLQVTIKDNGPGVPSDLRSSIFDPFVTTKTNGSGLGLAFVAKSVADHGGVIELINSGKGTEFRLSLAVSKYERGENE